MLGKQMGQKGEQDEVAATLTTCQEATMGNMMEREGETLTTTQTTDTHLLRPWTRTSYLELVDIDLVKKRIYIYIYHH